MAGARTERVGQGATLRVAGTHEQWDEQEFAHHVALGHVHTVGGDLESSVAGDVTPRVNPRYSSSNPAARQAAAGP